ncbi:short chain dehydrogenase [Bordetella genomosp. 9]|uniref:Short chain dehydrogenase n=1 Tax=Bordetella genomosp. 9 TaxID=1416803 RepID=A0A261RLI3_9BORD|nr:SDR family oxidoreductase [Bordetella genomosp. 9]OZI25879.1 short chain dehydrogenase [Bordetella genomosp. 9]
MNDLRGKRIAVLGGSTGIGLATAMLAAAADAHVLIAGRSADKLADARTQHPAIAESAALDLTDAAAVARFFASHDDWDHVVVCGSQTRTGPVRDTGDTGGAAGLPLDDAYEAMRSKFWSAYHAARACRIRRGGSLTLVSGVFSVRPDRNAVLQGAINAALEGLMRGLALEMAPIRVNAISPSVTDTPLWNKLDEAQRRRKFESYAAHVPLGHVAQPDAVARAILAVAGNPAITGSTLLVDCGDAIA